MGNTQPQIVRPKILAVDDRPENVFAIEQTLKSLGAEIFRAYSGEEALGLVLRHQFALILLDVQMPEMDGFETASLIRANKDSESTPIIFVTAISKQERYVRKGYQSGAVDYLFKPVDPDILRHKVRVFLDVDRKASALKEAQQQAEKENQTKSSFLAHVSHEIRTPLTAILGFSESLLEPKVPSSARLKAANIITNNSNHLLQIINDILDLSKINAGKMSIQLERCSLVQIVNSVQTILSQGAKEKGITLEVSYETAVPEVIETDGTRVKQILLNLVGNAIKFTDEGGVRIFVACDSAQELLTIKVKDTGIGLTKEQQNRLFGEFAQADASISKKYGGTGLGLAISQQLSEMLGGSIEADSVRGQGSTFTVKIATGILDEVSFLKPADCEREFAPVVSSAVSKKQQFQGQVLLAEDGEDNQRLVKHYLTKMGLSVSVVDNGALAVEEALEKDFDLVLMDVQMPIMSGLEAAKALRDQGYASPMIAFTANTKNEDIQQCLDVGYDGHLGKPFKKTELVSLIEKYCKSADEAELLLEPVLPRDLEEDQEVLEVICNFIDSLSLRVKEVELALAGSNWEKLRYYGHRFKSAKFFGYSPLAEIGIHLESAAKERDIAKITPIVGQLKSTASRIVASRQMINI